ncbi:hypothetical protein DKX38_027711 [Salix brachista]|uniref:Peptidase A1 domain-containing protein n=1 Tax=Salix brachista TaxID=2182728 RepID=A0A5N5J8J5_9ROSI|nr:hypothetical protein DKX38_027711 [Salix brachista]
MFHKSTKRQQVYIFLSGLDDRFDQVRGEVLRKDPPLGLQASYAYGRHEADKKEAMKMEVDRSEPVAMATRTQKKSIHKLDFQDIDATGILYASSISQVCLAFAGNSDATDVFIYGNVKQKTLEVFYDGSAGKVGFAPGGCS